MNNGTAEPPGCFFKSIVNSTYKNFKTVTTDVVYIFSGISIQTEARKAERLFASLCSSVSIIPTSYLDIFR